MALGFITPHYRAIIKTLMCINVNVHDLYLNVIYMSQLKGVLMRGNSEEGGGGKTD